MLLRSCSGAEKVAGSGGLQGVMAKPGASERPRQRQTRQRQEFLVFRACVVFSVCVSFSVPRLPDEG